MHLLGMFGVQCFCKSMYACVLNSCLCLHCKLNVCVFWVGGVSVHGIKQLSCCFGLFPFGSRPSIFVFAYSEWLY